MRLKLLIVCMSVCVSETLFSAVDSSLLDQTVQGDQSLAQL